MNLTFEVNGPDITERDNATLAIGVQRIVNACAPLYNARLISSRELIRMVYRFVGAKAPELTGQGFSPVEPKAVAGGSMPIDPNGLDNANP